MKEGRGKAGGKDNGKSVRRRPLAAGGQPVPFAPQNTWDFFSQFFA